MNKHQFLAELSQYLSFLSAEDRARVLEAYATRFEALEPEQEFALIAELGSPMRVAIELKRRLEAGERIVEGGEEPPEEPVPEEDSPAAETLQDIPAEEAIDDEAAGQEAGETPADGLNVYSVETETEEALLSEEESAEETASVEEAPSANVMKPFGAKLIFALIGASLLSLFIAAFFLGLAAVGGGFLVATSHLMIAGLKNLQYLTNALLLFGGGLAALALGLVIVWFSVWSAISLIQRLFGAVRRTGLRYTDKEAKRK